ncbi:hypothetical protein K492DRAFT_199572 [Lichtheimia hyalospora FSU 10163]|nr:hypothetical protein K492DRAFT_199572 [Lichtheimia hyalospora FSU 10163]
MADSNRENELQQRIETLLDHELLKNVPKNPTIEELETLIAIEQGRAYRIKVDRNKLEPIYIVVKQASSVREIKKLIQIQFGRIHPQQRVSWKYIWRTFCLSFKGKRLLDNEAIVSQLGIAQDSVLTFTKLAFDKGNHRSAWRRRQHR